MASGLSMKMLVFGTRPCFHQGYKIGHHLLRALDGEGRDEHHAAPGGCGIDFACQQFAALVLRALEAVDIAVGRLADDIVPAGRRFGIGFQHLVVGANVAGEQDAERLLASRSTSTSIEAEPSKWPAFH